MGILKTTPEKWDTYNWKGRKLIVIAVNSKRSKSSRITENVCDSATLENWDQRRQWEIAMSNFCPRRFLRCIQFKCLRNDYSMHINFHRHRWKQHPAHLVRFRHLPRITGANFWVLWKVHLCGCSRRRFTWAGFKIDERLQKYFPIAARMNFCREWGESQGLHKLENQVYWRIDTRPRYSWWSKHDSVGFSVVFYNSFFLILTNDFFHLLFHACLRISTFFLHLWFQICAY